MYVTEDGGSAWRPSNQGVRAVFLSDNANLGLPFVPTFTLLSSVGLINTPASTAPDDTSSTTLATPCW